MNLPKSKAKEAFANEIKIIETNLKAATGGEQDDHLLSLVQKRLDRLAEKYQYDDEVGEERYKLYELQALLHYFSGEDRDAFAFINTAIDTRGESYPRAEKLLAQLGSDDYDEVPSDPKALSKQERRKRKIGLEGWLAFFCVGIGLATLTYLGLGVIYTLNLVAIESRMADDYAVSVMGPYYGFNIFFGFLLGGVGIWLLVLLAKWRKLARWVGIAFLAGTFVFAFIDYLWYEDLLTKLSGLEPNSTGSVGIAIIWIIYLCVSRRVKRTLVR